MRDWNTVGQVAFHAGIHGAVLFQLQPQHRYAIFKYNQLHAASIIPCFVKLLSLPMVVWNYHALEYAWLLNVVVFTAILESLSGMFSFSFLW